MKGLLLLLAGIPLIATAQNIQPLKADEANYFVGNMNWEHIRAKAKQERKFIFVDCMTTWCIPCKKMEEVYADQKVAGYVQKNFIAVKVQMDTSQKDNELIKSWYADAAAIQATFKVTSFPSYLFFSPDGEIVHRDMGYKWVNPFLDVLKNATDPSRQFYTLLSKYKSGNLEPSLLYYLTNFASSLHEKELAKKIGRDCINQYLLTLSDDKLFTPDTISFIGTYVTSRDKEAFQIFYTKSAIIDSVMKGQDVPGYSDIVINWVISNEEIYPRLWLNNDKRNPVTNSPDWRRIFRTIKRKYSYALAEKTVLNAKILWYQSNKQWPLLLQSQVAKMEKYGIDTTGITAKFNLNNMVWYQFFLHTNDSVTLLKAAGWMEVLVKADYLKTSELYPGWVDTYANVLYKAGRVKDALYWEQKAIALAPDDKDFRIAYEKMQQSVPTWEVKE